MAGHTDYIHGTMPIDGHKKTYVGFAKISAFFTAFIVVILLMPILVFTAHMAWLPALIVTFIVGVVIAPMFKLGGGWYALLIGMAILTAIISFLIALFAG